MRAWRGVCECMEVVCARACLHACVCVFVYVLNIHACINVYIDAQCVGACEHLCVIVYVERCWDGYVCF